MKSHLKRYVKGLFLTFLWAGQLVSYSVVQGQTCTGSTPANPGTLTGTNYTGVNINPSNGLRNWFTGGTLGGANINISSNSTLIIKTGSFLTLTGATTIPTGSTIYIESGAGLSIPGSLTVQGTFINLGTLTISGNNFLQVNGGAVYNDGTISATSSYLHLTNLATYTFLNGGSCTFTYLNWQITTGSNPVCLRPGSIFNLLSSNSGSVIAGTGAFPSGGLFQYNTTDISSNSSCTPANPARINYVASFTPTNGLVWGPTGLIANNSKITIVGSTPSTNGTGSGFGTSTRVTSGTGYSAATPQNYNLTTHSPVPAVTGNYFQYCKNSTVPLSGMASGSNLLWYTVATGGTGSATAPTVNTATAGLQTFWVSQNVTGSCEGPRNPININVSNTAANALTASNNGPICTGGTLTLSASATGISSWSWSGPNSYTSTTQNPTVSTNTTLAMAGTYTVIALQTTGSCNNSASTTVSVGAPAQPSAFTTSSATVCQGQSNVTYTVPAVSGATSYTWTYSGTGASITGTTNSISINYSSVATSGTLSVSATNTCGTSTARTMNVTVNPGIYLVPTTGLIAYYKLNGNANDELVTNQGTLQNAPSSTTDRFGNANFAYSFDGSTQYVSTTTTYNTPTDFTISIWFNTTTNTGGRLIGFSSSQTGGSAYFDRHIYMNDMGQIYFGVYPNVVRTINSTNRYNNGVWHMATASLSSTNGMKLYIDGALVASDATTTTAQNFVGYWRIAYDNNGGWNSSPTSNYFNGSLDDAIIYNTELTAAQVSTLYSSASSASSNSPVCSGGTLNLTAPTVSGATYSWTGPNSFSSSSQNPSISAMSAANEGAYVLTTTVSGCSVVSYAKGAIDPEIGSGVSQIPTSGLISKYKLDGNANDASGQYNIGTLQNGPTATTDRFGNASSAYLFNGTNQFISTSNYYVGPDNLTMSLWFKTTTTSGGKLIGFGDSKTGQSGAYDRHIYMNNSGQIYFGVYPNALRTLNTSAAYNDGNWHMVTATLSAAGMKLYMDGALIQTDASTTNGQSYSGYFKIGFDNLSGWTSQPGSFYFNGSIDDVLIYNTALTATQITTLYNAPEGAGSNSAVCVNSTLNLSAPTVAGVTYAWTGPNGFSSSLQNPSFTFLPVNAGTYTLVTTATSGCKSTGYALVTLNTTTPGLWNGSVNTSWQTANNWCGGAVPVSTTDVVIPAVVNLPINSSTANAKNITINSSASLTNTTAGILNVYGNWTNNGTFTDNSIYTSAGVVNFVGTTAQTLTGATTFSNLTLNNTAGLTLSSATTVNGILTLTAGNLNSGGNLNQNLYTGGIAGTGSGSTSGNIRFFKTIWGDRYHYLSVPISGMTAADWNDNVTIKFGANSNLYSYNEALPDTNKKVGWTALASTSTALNSMQGYALYFPRWIYNTTLDVTGTYTHSASFNSGTLNNTPSTTPTFKPASDGWQFMGNPYPSDIDWNAATGWTKTGITDAIYTWDGRTNKFVSYVAGVGTNGGSRYIGSMQGFFVKVSASGGTGTLAMNNNVRVTSVLHDVWRARSEDKILRLSIATDSINSDETIIRFSQNATEKFDDNLDAYKFINDSSVPSLFSLSDEADYSINSLPASLSTQIIPLQVKAMKSDLHTWTADLSGFNENETLYLEDRLLGTMQKLNDSPTSSLNLDKGTIAGRFFIHYNTKESGYTGNTNTGSSIVISAINQNVFLLFDDQNSGVANISIFDALGKKVYAAENVSISSGRIDINLPQVNAGIFIVKAQTSTAARTQQVMIQK